jgi:predicted site-specific integrase-resolvase
MPRVDEFMQIAEAAEFLGVCQNTLRNWGRSDKIKEYRHPVNNYRLYKQAELQRLLSKIEPVMSAKVCATRKRNPR